MKLVHKHVNGALICLVVATISEAAQLNAPILASGLKPKEVPPNVYRGYLDHNGRQVLKVPYKWFGNFHEGLAAARSDSGLSGYIDRTGKMVIPPRFNRARNFSEGLAPVEIGHKWGFIDHTGKFIVDPKFLETTGFSEGVAAVHYTSSKGEAGNYEILSGYIDKKGEVVLPLKNCTNTSIFREGLALKNCADSQNQFITRLGQTMLKPGLGFFQPFSEGLAPTSSEGGIEYRDSRGQVFKRTTAHRCTPFKQGISISYILKTDTLRFEDRTGKITL
jgi:KWG Leptospira.